MNNQDQLFRFMFEQLDVRGELVYLQSSWQSVLERYPYPDTVQQQLGQALIAVALLASSIKFEGSLILQIQGDGPLRTLVAQASSEGKIRAVAKWDGDVPTGTLPEVYGQGQIVITIKNTQGEPYQSIVALKGDSLSAALEQYFLTSEQLKSRFWFFIDQDRIAGLFLQELPAQVAQAQTIDDNWDRINHLAATATAEEVLNLPPQTLLHRLFHTDQVSLFEPKATQFECSCSREKVAGSLLAIGRDALLEILQEEGEIKADCEFCRMQYQFSPSDIDHLFAIQDDPEQSQTTH